MKQGPGISVLLPSDAAVHARRQALVGSLSGGGSGGPRRRRTPRLLVAVAALLVASAGAALAAGVFSADKIDVGSGVGCYGGPSFRADAAIFRSAADPVAKCARVWREGAMTGGTSTEVPHLVACTAEDEPVRVFPGPNEELCGRLGLVPLPADYAAVGRAHARAHAAWFELTSREVPAPSSACPSPRAWAKFARRLLSRTYPDVPVFVEGAEPCAGGYELARDRTADRIAVVTVTRAHGRANLDARERRRYVSRMRDAIDHVFGRPPRFRRTREKCIPPAQIAAEVRRGLVRGGFGDVQVRIQGKGECTHLRAQYTTCCFTEGRGDAERFVATVMTMTRASWSWTKRDDSKWKRLREQAEIRERRSARTR